ncbi:ABC transporter substrate-binding protein [Specibacter cremeus]|uniref:ABC transporter substrate-binding protein n=1 Tax=Specibacter cremeus TaxID=1629051 RepID=UPI0013DDEC6A|nr:ABC transporter substrate-binding protein [Specibacter cremeus]
MEPNTAVRFVVVGPQPPPEPVDPASLYAELLDTTRILEYAHRLWGTGNDRLSFFLDLPASRRMARVTLAKDVHGPSRLTVVECTLATAPHQLTSREMEVLTLLAAGHSNPAIARYLFTSPRTVSTQVETIRAKLGAISRTAASVLAAQNGWLKLPLSAPPEDCAALAIAALELEPGTGRALPDATGASPIRLVLAYPQSGAAADDGLQSLRGALLAVEELNRRGGIRGRRIDPFTVDSNIYSRNGIQETFARIRALDADAVMMSYVFDEATALDEAAHLAIPVIHTMTSQRQVLATDANPGRYRNVFQCVPTETNYGTGIVRFLDLLEADKPELCAARTISFIETPADAGQVADDPTLALLHGRGWRVLSVDPAPDAPGAYGDLARQVVARDPSVIVVSEFLPRRLADAFGQLLDTGSNSLIYCIYAPSIPVFEQLVGERAEGLVWSTVSGTYPDSFGKDFVAEYARRYGSSPGLSQAGLGYDMAHILASAWRSSADTRDIAGTLDALRQTRHRGVNGSYIFSPRNQTSLSYPDQTADPSFGQAQLVLQVQDGRHRALAPAPYAEAHLRTPPWVRPGRQAGNTPFDP